MLRLSVISLLVLEYRFYASRIVRVTTGWNRVSSRNEITFLRVCKNRLVHLQGTRQKAYE